MNQDDVLYLNNGSEAYVEQCAAPIKKAHFIAPNGGEMWAHKTSDNSEFILGMTEKARIEWAFNAEELRDLAEFLNELADDLDETND